MSYRFNMDMGKEEERFLKDLAAEVGCSSAQLVRWALAWYAHTGPWTTGSAADRAAAVEMPQDYDFGPRRKVVLK